MELLQQLIFECAVDLAQDGDTKEHIVTRLLELSDVKVKFDSEEKSEGA